MPYTKRIFRPGINREGTAYDNEDGWFDCNLIRFRNGHVEKMSGWEKLSSNTYLGTSRALHNWMSLGSNLYLGIGTTFKYYIKDGTVYNDITPIRATTTNGIVFAATNGSSTITATDNAHGAVTGDFVTLAGAVSLGGVVTAAVLNQEYQIASVPSVNTYTFVAKDTAGDTVTANSSDTGNGGSGVDGAYQISVGLDSYVPSAGWGSGTWGSGTFGSTTALTAIGQLRLWTHDNFGENLIINPRGGGIYRWVENNGTSTRALDLSGLATANLVPTLGLQVITSEIDRHLIVLGADPISGSARSGVLDPMLVAFSDQENELEFEPLITNTAGSLRLSSGSNIVGAVKSRQEIIIFTDTSVYSMQFVGPPFTFAINLINEATGLLGPKAAITADSGVYFMSYGSFYIYNGTVEKLPCTVQSYVFSDFNDGQAYKVHAFSNSENNEIGWFYPSASATEIDRYVIYNTQEKVWYYGELERTSWLDSGVVNYPQATKDNYLYQHEIGYDDDGSAMTNVFIESSDFDLDDGDRFTSISSVIPDIRFLQDSNNGSVNIVTKTRNYPGQSLTTRATSEITSSTTKANIRARGRQAVLRVESNDDQSGAGNVSLGWRLGATRIDVKNDGRR
ncbi:hypothetical protein N9P69_00940 [Gammaproteobacteria bacterium]|jgi:hypothetical protein|nr:hypothetical protein [Gammaproteobacteria bacterium]|tara:strand:+ start:148 stop:2013 length:1866 start_codon:yes stop_codon:yes gene_type:complete